MTHDVRLAKNKDLAASLLAMKRAAQAARDLAIATNTAIVIEQDGKLIRIPAEELRKMKQTDLSA